MKKKSYIIIIILLILLLIFALVFKVKLEVKNYNRAKQATEIAAIEELGEGCMLLDSGMYLGPPPYSRGFWFGFVDKNKIKATVFTAVPTLDGNNWYVRVNISQTGGDHRNFFKTLQ